jgi:hypothetical protein
MVYNNNERTNGFMVLHNILFIIRNPSINQDGEFGGEEEMTEIDEIRLILEVNNKTSRKTLRQRGLR